MIALTIVDVVHVPADDSPVLNYQYDVSHS